MARLRQVVLVTADLAATAAALRAELALPDPHADPGVATFGVENLVFAAGDCFVELLAPTDPASAAARHLARHGGDAGYMAIFQLDDNGALDAARRRVRDLGVRVVWQADSPDQGIAGTHLHPRDVPGAIVSLDAAEPPTSWAWAGPAWTGGAPAGAAALGGLTSLTVGVADPDAAAGRWRAVLGGEPAGQELRFVEGPDRILAWGLRLAGESERAFDLGGVHFEIAG